MPFLRSLFLFAKCLLSKLAHVCQTCTVNSMDGHTFFAGEVRSQAAWCEYLQAEDFSGAGPSAALEDGLPLSDLKYHARLNGHGRHPKRATKVKTDVADADVNAAPLEEPGAKREADAEATGAGSEDAEASTKVRG